MVTPSLINREEDIHPTYVMKMFMMDVISNTKAILQTNITTTIMGNNICLPEGMVAI